MTIYELYPTEGLIDHLKSNMDELAGAVRNMIGDGPMPDPRIAATEMRKVTTAEYMEMMRDTNMRDMVTIQLAIADIAKENALIHKELLTRL